MGPMLLPIALGVVMLSLGLALTLDDFRRVLKFPRAVIVALLCQTVLLPLACFGICIVFKLPPELAVGLMLLAASPGGIVANVFSHLANGDLALNITLTAVNSALSMVTLPLLLAGSLIFFMEEGRVIPPQFGKIVQVFMIVLVPVAIGMLLRARNPALATRLDKPVKIFATLFLIFAATFAIIAAWDTMVQFFAELGAAVVTFCLLSLVVGYSVPRLLRIGPRQATAISMEIGLHNGALAIAIALSPMILNSPVMAVPPALYGVVSPFIAAAFAVFLNRRLSRSFE
ncbi:MAG: bile acid:sodium symporter family protein [Panacagrimonas sp.]